MIFNRPYRLPKSCGKKTKGSRRRNWNLDSQGLGIVIGPAKIGPVSSFACLSNLRIFKNLRILPRKGRQTAWWAMWGWTCYNSFMKDLHDLQQEGHRQQTMEAQSATVIKPKGTLVQSTRYWLIIKAHKQEFHGFSWVFMDFHGFLALFEDPPACGMILSA